MRQGNRYCRSRWTPGLLVIRLTTERPIDISLYRSKTGYNDALKHNRTLVTIPCVHFCAQACQGDIYKTVYERCAAVFNASEERLLQFYILLKS